MAGVGGGRISPRGILQVGKCTVVTEVIVLEEIFLVGIARRRGDGGENCLVTCLRTHVDTDISS